jgi:response regulator RpfG family c-di-GMP phosphodiesterase
MSKKISFLIADDEIPVLITLKTLIAKTFPDATIYETQDGNDAFNIIENKEPHIVISDLNMPGINGIDLCKKIRSIEKHKFIFFIALTASTEKEQRILALKSGADDFLNKPFVFDEFQARISSGVRIAKMQEKLKEENQLLIQLADALEEEIQDMIKLAVKFLQARIPASLDTLKRVADASVWIARKLGINDRDELRDIEISAFLCHAGKIFLPDSMLSQQVMLDGQPSNKLMYQVPVSARDIVSTVRRFKDSANILYHLYENFDGSGFPNRVQSWQIPLGARIIRVVLDYEELLMIGKKSPKESIEELNKYSTKLYDQRVVVLFEQYLAANGLIDRNMREKAVQLAELAEGMIISRDVITNNGLKLMGSGTVLSEKLIERILSHNTSDPILGNLFIKT